MVSLETNLLAHGSRLNSEQTHGKVLGDGKCRRVQQFHTPTRDFIGFLLREMIRVAAIARNRTCRPRDILLRDVLGSGCARQDVQLSRGQMVKGGSIHAQVLGQNGFGIAFEELGDEKGAIFAEFSTVEDEEEFDAVVEGLDAVWDTGGEEPVFCSSRKGVWLVKPFSPGVMKGYPVGRLGKIVLPNIACLQVIYERLACFIHGRESTRSIENQTPLVSLVPVQFSVRIGFQMHINTCHSSSNR